MTSPSDPIRCDTLVDGAGIAGMRAAIDLAQHGDVLVVAKDTLRESSSEYAQGGIAVALSDDDEVQLHEQDTLSAGDGLCDRAAVHALVEDGPAAIQELIGWGTAFDREGAALQFTREGAHSRNRILHAHGDSTGREILRALHRHAATLPRIRLRSFAAVTDLLLADDGGVAGALALDDTLDAAVPIRANAVLLATGGLGHVFLNTTNPDVATGDGVAMAYRAGAAISDIEFVQFHPTALYVPGAPRFLLSEALRGEGGRLRNKHGERFMARYHALEELAPRDIVSRSIVAEMRRTEADCVWLDLTHLDAAFVRQRFPRIHETCLQFGVDIARQYAPVQPAAHYSMGGIRTDLEGRTSLPRLFAAGEAASNGVHGANRLASNSLLEGVVFGARAARAMQAGNPPPRGPLRPADVPLFPRVSEEELRQLAWEHCGILRDAAGLREALRFLDAVACCPQPNAHRVEHERRNMHLLARLIAQAALAREESRGGHYRTDFPAKRPEFQRHSVLGHGIEGVQFV